MAGYLNNRDIAAMKAAVEKTLTQNATISRPDYDGVGAARKTTTTVYADIKCKVSNANMPQMKNLEGTVVTELTYNITFPVNTDVRGNDTINIIDGDSYRVIDRIPTNPAISTRARCIQIH
jgi:hypothetical protein